MTQSLKTRSRAPEDEPGAPSPFRFSERGTLAHALEDAGFADVREESVTLPTTFPGDPQRWWEWLVDTAAPVQTWMATMTDVEREQAIAEIYEALRAYRDERSVNVPIDVIVAIGYKAGVNGLWCMSLVGRLMPPRAASCNSSRTRRLPHGQLNLWGEGP